MEINKRKTGEAYERRAARYLEDNGLKIIERNFRCKSGEIDIIALDYSDNSNRKSKYPTYVFAEVKFRSSSHAGNPCEAVNYKKQKNISKTAMYYKLIKKLPDNGSFRFDVVSILGDEITWYKDAFLYTV